MEVAMSYEGDKEFTLNRMVNEYQTALLRMCYLYLHDAALAEDAVQETFIRAYKGLDAFRGDCAEKTWLMRIAMNICRDMLRSAWFKHIDRRVTFEELPEPYETPSETDVELTLCVMRLPQKFREVIVLRYYQNMTTVEIADVLGVAQSTASSRLDRARRRLRAMLEGGRGNG